MVPVVKVVPLFSCERITALDNNKNNNNNNNNKYNNNNNNSNSNNNNNNNKTITKCHLLCAFLQT